MGEKIVLTFNVKTGQLYAQCDDKGRPTVEKYRNAGQDKENAVPEIHLQYNLQPFQSALGLEVIRRSIKGLSRVAVSDL